MTVNLKQGAKEYEFCITTKEYKHIIIRAGNGEIALEKAKKEFEKVVDENPHAAVELWDCYGETICGVW